MKDTSDRYDEPLPARRSQVLPPAAPPAEPLYDDYTDGPQPQAKKVSFRLVARALRRHWWQALLLWTVAASVLVFLAYTRIKPTFDAVSQVRVDLSEAAMDIFARSSTPTDLSLYMQTQVSLVTSPTVLEIALAKHPELLNFPLLRGSTDPEIDLRNALRVAVFPKTTLIQVEMSSNIPTESAEAVNAVVGAYLDVSQKTFDRATEKKIEQLKIAKKEKIEERDMRRKIIDDISEKTGVSVVERLKDRDHVAAETYRRLSDELTTVDIMVIKTKARLDLLNGQKILPTVAQDKGEMEELLKDEFYAHPQVAALQAQIERAETKLSDANRLSRNKSDPAVAHQQETIKELEKKKNKLWRDLQPRLRRRLTAAVPADESLEHAIKQAEVDLAAETTHRDTLKAMLDKVQVENERAEGDKLKLEDARLDLNRVERVVDTIETNLSQLELNAKSPIGRITLEYKARPSNRPDGNRRLQMMAAAPVITGLLVMGLFVLLELRGARVADPEELASRIHLQVIGVVPPLPQIRAGRGGGNGDGSGPPVTASDFRARREVDEFVQSLDHLRVALCARRDPWGRDRHCVLITSACGSEGKTTLAAQLAERCVNAGLMTLLIDADLRNPTLSRMLDASNSPGLINVLRGEMIAEDVVTVVGDAGGFHLLPAGTPRMDPSRLLQGDRLGKLLAQARESFDMIIVDAPPVLPVPDALTIGKWTDGAVLAVRYDTSRFPLVERANRRLAHVGVTVIGAVVNGVRSMESAYGGYYTYGGYGDVPAPAPGSSAAPGSTVMGG